MTIQEFKKQYYNQTLVKQLEMDALWKFIIQYCEEPKRDAVAILNGLIKNGVHNIDEFYKIRIEDIVSKRQIGKKRKEIVIRLKQVLNESIDQSSD